MLAKRAVLETLAPGERRALVPGWLWLTFAPNARGAMDLFGAPPPVMIVLALATIGAMSWFLRDLVRRSATAQVGFGLVLGGAIGNLVDRTVHGYVVDFVSLRGFYVFNVADAGITVGLVLLAVAALRARAVA